MHIGNINQKNRKMNIVIHSPRISYYVGGGEVVPLEHARFLAQRGHHITILTRETKKYSVVFQEFLARKYSNIKIEYINIDTKHGGILSEKPGKRWFRWDAEAILFGQHCQKFYEKLEKNHIVATHLSTDSLLIPRGFKNILHLHGTPLKNSEIIKLALLRPDSFCAHAKSIMNGWKRLFPEVKSKIELVHNGIDQEEFRPLGLVKDIDILFVGRFLENKGIQDLLKAINQNQIAVFIGDGPLRKEIEKARQKIKKIKILKHLEKKDLISYYNRARVFACPSTSKEGVLTTMLEAAACGCAIVTTNCCGMVDFAKHKFNSLLVPPCAPRELKTAIQRVLRDPVLQNRLSHNARESILKGWTWERKILTLEKIYQSIE